MYKVADNTFQLKSLHWRTKKKRTWTSDTTNLQMRPLTHWGRDKIASILLMTFSNAFSWMKMYVKMYASIIF